MLAEMGLPALPKYRHSLRGRGGQAPTGAARHKWVAVPCLRRQPRGCAAPPTHQLDTSGVAVPALRALLQHVGGSRLQREHRRRGLAGTPAAPQPRSLGQGCAWCRGAAQGCTHQPSTPRPLQPILTGGRLTSQYACSWQSMTMRSPFRRCLAALPVQRQREGAGTLPALAPEGAPSPAAPQGAAVLGHACTHRSCSRACITTKSHVWLIRLCRRL